MSQVGDERVNIAGPVVVDQAEVRVDVGDIAEAMGVTVFLVSPRRREIAPIRARRCVHCRL
ncbi:hypothetical protein [Arthrobacter sp. fls2-241-R2A-200]|uniref:hypothetical protein n=1 Tax=unclassified Arthrobacter TaxID=235627 RepID=UPI00254CF464|nr:hypothetical protein [Arthrobacter sp. fls2-241-R2A-200]